MHNEADAKKIRLKMFYPALTYLKKQPKTNAWRKIW